MKLLLDTINKTIKIEEAVNLGELIATLEKLLPSSTWERFTLETNTQIVWQNPIIIREYEPVYPCITYPYITYPWYDPGPTIHYTSDGVQGTQQLQTGIYCIEV